MTGILNHIDASGTSPTGGIRGDLDMIRGNGLYVRKKESNWGSSSFFLRSGRYISFSTLDFKLVFGSYYGNALFYKSVVSSDVSWNTAKYTIQDV